jgi:hypothetical protein
MTPNRGAIIASLVMAGACSRAVVAPSAPAPVPAPEQSAVRGPQNSRRTLGIPPGQLPRPGQCRVWIQGLPPGHEPRARSCAGIAQTAPAGSMILYRPSRDPGVVQVHYVDQNRAGVIVRVGVFNSGNGGFVRDEGASSRLGDDEGDNAGKGHGRGRGHGNH